MCSYTSPSTDTPARLYRYAEALHYEKVERHNRILAEEFLCARAWQSGAERAAALEVRNLHYNYHRPHGAYGGQPLASVTPSPVNNVWACCGYLPPNDPAHHSRCVHDRVEGGGGRGTVGAHPR